MLQSSLSIVIKVDCLKILISCPSIVSLTIYRWFLWSSCYSPENIIDIITLSGTNDSCDRQYWKKMYNRKYISIVFKKFDTLILFEAPLLKSMVIWSLLFLLFFISQRWSSSFMIFSSLCVVGDVMIYGVHEMVLRKKFKSITI